ncbi:hypothetical protein, partial [Escherichia coli]|uniref:hypothetical protein n=1 Tax=Escherichia coli TaxID=562 RepID=UPI0032DB3589
IDFWRTVRKNKGDDEPKLSGQREMLIWEYGKLLEIIVKCALGGLGGFDRLTIQYSHYIYAVLKTTHNLD